MNRWDSHKPILLIKEFVLSPRALSLLYNAALNMFWSLLAFAPVSIFCYRFMEQAWLWAFVVASVIALMMPASTLKYLELSSTVMTYRKLGVHWVNHFVQHGILINHLVRRRYPEHGRMQSRAGKASLLQSQQVARLGSENQY